MSGRFENRVALVTGGDSLADVGIGRDPKLVKLAGKRPSRYHLHDIRELFRRKRSSPDLDEA
jgi:hypothetical protein